MGQQDWRQHYTTIGSLQLWHRKQLHLWLSGSLDCSHTQAYRVFIELTLDSHLLLATPPSPSFLEGPEVGIQPFSQAVGYVDIGDAVVPLDLLHLWPFQV